jgi:hypothetical protein
MMEKKYRGKISNLSRIKPFPEKSYNAEFSNIINHDK